MRSCFPSQTRHSFPGYVKPFFEDLDFNNLEDKNKGVFSRIWENVVQGLAWLVKNKPQTSLSGLKTGEMRSRFDSPGFGGKILRSPIAEVELQRSQRSRRG